ncbi:MAG: hypothetical protein JXR77_19390 [Lentisphaeria bacterium]|nr:hypothetical protein [Lentisphaeria bacterium]
MPAPKALRVRFRYRATTRRMDGFVRLWSVGAKPEEVGMLRWDVAPPSAEWGSFERDFRWRVRYRVGEEWSEWTSPRRFRVLPDADPFPVPPVAELLSRVPTGHPRLWTTPEGLVAFRARSRGPRQERTSECGSFGSAQSGTTRALFPGVPACRREGIGL